MSNIQNQSFEMNDTVLQFDPVKSALLCKSRDNGRKLWIKKLPDIAFIIDVSEHEGRYYLTCESGEINGQFIAISKATGKTDWFIPGKSFLHIIHKDFMYLIFPDDKNQFYLIKVRPKDGKSLWYHEVGEDLDEYVFYDNEIKLKYKSKKYELVSIRTGEAV